MSKPSLKVQTVGGGVAVAVGVGVGDEHTQVHPGPGKHPGGHGDGAQVGVGPDPLIVISPLFWSGEVEFSCLSINSKSSGCGFQVKAVELPGTELTRFHLISKRVPLPLNGVTPSFEKAEMRSLLSVPGPVFSTFPETVQPVAVRPAV